MAGRGRPQLVPLALGSLGCMAEEAACPEDDYRPPDKEQLFAFRAYNHVCSELCQATGYLADLMPLPPCAKF